MNIHPDYPFDYMGQGFAPLPPVIPMKPGPINHFPTVKDTNPKDLLGQTKLPMHLVSGIVKAYQAVAHWLGNVKYGAWNYRAKGARASVYRAALDRHMDAWWEGEENDPVDGTPHLANALACINILIETKEAGNLDDDRPPKSNYRAVVDRLTPLIPALAEKYKDMNPHHYRETDNGKTN